MAKLTKKTIENIFNDFKDSLFINSSLDKYKIRYYDFYEYLKENEEANKEFKKIEEYNLLILEDRAAQQAFQVDGNPKIKIEFLKANNKKKFTPKIEVENTSVIKGMSDEEVDAELKRLLNKYNL